MKKYRVTLKTVYEVQAEDPTHAEGIAQEQFVKDGVNTLASTVAEVKPKNVVEDEEL